MNFDPIYLDILGGLSCPLRWALLSLGSFLLGWLLHWLLFGRSKQLEIDRLTADNGRLSGKLEGMDAEMTSLKYKLDQADENVNIVKRDLYKCESDKVVLQTKLDKMAANTAGATDASADTTTKTESEAADHSGSGDASAEVLGVMSGGTGSSTKEIGALPYGKIFADDNLQIIEGIGPKIEQLLKDAGFQTWSALAGCKLDAVQKVLDDAGPRYRMHNPKSWPEQAQLANDGKWEELVKYQKFLDSGREGQNNMASPAKIEKLGMKILGFSSNPEDLKIVEGIGPKIEKLLKDAGVNNWAELASTPVDKLKSILADAGERYRLADPSTWPKQADLAATGKWSDLSDYQDYLDGGKEPAK